MLFFAAQIAVNHKENTDGSMLPLSQQTREFLITYLNERVKHLHHSISLHENDGTAALATFIERYMALAPDFVTAFNDFLNSANISGEIARQVITARDFIEVPVGIVSSQEGLEAQIYKAYLAHRLLEELNDTLKAIYDCPIIPVDMTRSNLIVHHIIGEPFANQLDAAIQSLSDRLVRAIETDSVLQSELRVYCSSVNKQGMPNYPCLAEACHIYLVFNTEKSASD